MIFVVLLVCLHCGHHGFVFEPWAIEMPGGSKFKPFGFIGMRTSLAEAGCYEP